MSVFVLYQQVMLFNDTIQDHKYGIYTPHKPVA